MVPAPRVSRNCRDERVDLQLSGWSSTSVARLHVPWRCMAYLQYFGAGFATLGVLAVIASLVSPHPGGVGTIVLGVVSFFVGIAVFVLAVHRA